MTNIGDFNLKGNYIRQKLQYAYLPGNTIPFQGCIMPEFVIERIGEQNFHEFLHLLDGLADYESLDPPDEAGRLRLKADLMHDPPIFEGYIGRLGGKPVGFATFYFTYSTFLARPTLFLEDIFVPEDCRGQGFGSRLFEFCRNESRIRGCGRMEWMVLTWNEPSIRFYEKIGAERLGWYTYRLNREDL